MCGEGCGVQRSLWKWQIKDLFEGFLFQRKQFTTQKLVSGRAGMSNLLQGSLELGPPLPTGPTRVLLLVPGGVLFCSSSNCQFVPHHTRRAQTTTSV